MFASMLATLVAASFLGLGGAAAIAPRALSRNYGLPVADETGDAYVRALGARDAAFGLLALSFLLRSKRRALAQTLAAAALVGGTDFVIVFAARGPQARNNLAIHGGGTLGLIAVCALLCRDA